VRYRASLEALAYLIGVAIREHEEAGQEISRITVSGGIAKSDLMCEILASVLGFRLERLVSNEGPALGAAVAALAGMESFARKQKGIAEPCTVGDAVSALVRFRERVRPVDEWLVDYDSGLDQFRARIR
jgi:sugar (pentulose or hexulose) kinase